MLYIDVKGIIDNEQTKAMFQFWGGGYEVFTHDNLKAILDANPKEEEVTLNIDCDGGSVEEGLKIYDLLRTSGKTIYTNITGGCHSMAVVILLAAPPENRSANRNVRALIHRVYTEHCGMISADDCLFLAEGLIVEEDAILDIYAERTEVEREVLANVMREEKIHNAQSLLELNFISKINTYNTNQFYNSILRTMNGKNKTSAYGRFMGKLNAHRQKMRGGAVNFDYLDAEGEVVFFTDAEEDTLAIGDSVTLSSGEASGTFILDDGREVVVEDNIVVDIVETENESIEERVEELEDLLEEATNVIVEQQRELRNLKGGSNYKPANRQVRVPATRSNRKGQRVNNVEDIKAEANGRMEAARNRRKIVK